MPGWPEILVILLIVLLLFGPKKLPELARGLAQSINEFRKAKDEFSRELHSAVKDAEKTAQDLPIKESPGKQPHSPS